MRPTAATLAASPGTGHGKAEQLLRRLEWTVLRRLDGLLQGDYRTLLHGTGMDLADLREYQYHDDVRHIDWNVTARLDQPHVRVFTEDREMSAWFLLDLSASVDFGSGEQRKRDVSAEFVAVLARLLTSHGNRVGALLYGCGVDTVIPARGSRQHVLQLLHTLQTRPMADDAGVAGKAIGPTRLHELLQAAATLVRRRSTLFVVSDFISEPGWEQSLGLLAQRHDVVAVRLLDPLELALPDLGLIPICDVETGEQLLVDTHDAGFRKRFARIAAQREADLRQALASAGVDTLELSTDGSLVDAIMRFTDLRKCRSRSSGVRAAAAKLPAHFRPAA
ncbi:MAG: ATPase [Burkholderiales bacterium RIFCSPHIGHO2_12_FULL_61_11]|nr:MAG: ATPase [Burkholderiales bacterium RIFCSPHIGHO2_12_FULL_61_11]